MKLLILQEKKEKKKKKKKKKKCVYSDSLKDKVEGNYLSQYSYAVIG